MNPVTSNFDTRFKLATNTGFDTRFKLIATNTGEVSIQRALAQSKIVLFCERHLVRKYQAANSFGINSLWERGSRLAVESDVRKHLPGVGEEIYASSEVWENHVVAAEAFREVEDFEDTLYDCSKEIIKIVMAASNLLVQHELNALLAARRELAVQDLSDEEDSSSVADYEGDDISDASSIASNQEDRMAGSWEEFYELIEGLDEYDSIIDESLIPQRDHFTIDDIDSFLKNLGRAWCDKFHEKQLNMDQVLDQQAVARNELLSQSAVRISRETQNKIFIIAGTDHLQKRSEMSALSLQAVDRLYQSLQEAGIAYTTIKASNRYQKEQARQLAGPAEQGKRSASVRAEEDETSKRTHLAPEEETSYLEMISEYLLDSEEYDGKDATTTTASRYLLSVQQKIMLPLRDQGRGLFN